MAITDPTDIAGLVFWGDAVVITENPSGFCEVMDNQEGTATEDISQSTSDDRPSLVTVLGKIGLQFAGAVPADHLVGGSVTPVAGTLVFVLKLPPAVSDFDAVMWYGGTASVSTVPAIWKDDDDVRFMVGRGNISGIAFSASPDSDWTWGDDVMVTLTWDGSTDAMALRINKIAKGSGTAALLGAMSGMCVGARGDGGLGSAINAYGLVVYDSILTGTNLTDIEEFMTNTYLPVNILTADAGADQTVDADESDTAVVILDGTDSFGPDPITNFEWKEGAVVLATGPDDVAIVELSVGAHTIVLTVTDINGIDTDTVIKTVDAFVPPTPPPIRTFKEITSSTGVVHTFNDVFPLTPRLTLLPFTEFHNQLRVFKKIASGAVTELFPVGRPSSAGVTDFSIDTDGTQITLDVALISSDTLLIMRDTTMFHSFIIFTGSSRFHGTDRNVQGDQILFVAQELREIRAIADILGSASGEPFEYTPELINDENWKQVFTADGVITDFLYSSIEMMPPTAVIQDGQLLVFVDDVLQTIATDYTVDTVAFTVNFVSAPANDSIVEIRRSTRIDKRWVVFRDGSTFSSLQDVWDFLNVKFIIEETPGFPTFIIPNALSNRIFPRALNFLNFSGPGDRFFFGNLAWFGDGTVFVFKNDLLLVEGIDYTINFIFFFIDITIAAGDTLQIVTTTPNNAFGRLSWGIPGGKENSPTEESEEPEGVVLSGTEDAILVKGSADTNFSSSRSMVFNWKSDPVRVIQAIQFNVADLDPTTFDSIRLAYFVTAKISVLGVDVLIRRCLRQWDINKSLTWNEWKAGSPWTTPGGQGSDTDFDSASEVSWLTIAPSPSVDSYWISPDLSTMITAARADDNILRLLLVAQNVRLLHAVGTVEHRFENRRPMLIPYL